MNSVISSTTRSIHQIFKVFVTLVKYQKKNSYNILMRYKRAVNKAPKIITEEKSSQLKFRVDTPMASTDKQQP